MNELPSAQFRTQYAKLKEPAVVTVNGHPIGVWTPGATGHPFTDGLREGAQRAVPTVQAARDDLLRKINRSK